MAGCAHLTAVGYTDPETHPEQQDLAPGQVRCLNPACRRVFTSDLDWCRAQDQALEAARQETIAARLHSRAAARRGELEAWGND